MNESASRGFLRAYKKLHKDQLTALHRVMNEVMKNPEMGEEKKGDLRGIYIVKFKIGKQERLLAYFFNLARKKITWEAIGPHENFYRELKK